MFNGVYIDYIIVIFVTGAILLAAIYHTILYLQRIKDLNFDQLKNIELTVGGYLADEEGLAAPLPLEFKCSECSGNFPNNIFRNLKFITFPSTQSSIENLLNNGTFQPLKFRGDNFFELNYYEEGIKEHGWAKFMWKVWVKPHL